MDHFRILSEIEQTAAYWKLVLKQGHQCNVRVAAPSPMLPVPGAPERAFFEELENNGIQTGRFNLPVWQETIDSLHTLIDGNVPRHSPHSDRSR